MSRPHPALIELAAGCVVEAVPDEAELLRSVAEHRMTGATLAAHRSGRIALSNAAATTLSVWELGQQRYNLGFWRTVAEIRRRLGPLSIEVAVLKGVATEWRWYGAVGRRVCTDVDVLLSPASFGQLREIIPALDPGRSDVAAIDGVVGRGQLQHVDLVVGSTHVDLHFDAFKVGIPTRQIEEVWDCTEVLPTPHGDIRVLRPEHELVLLLLHLNKDGFSYLGPFLDIERILARAPLDWPYLEAFVEREGLAVPVWRSLAAVAETLRLDVAIPPGRRLRDRTWSRLWGRANRLRGDEGRRRAPSVQRLLPLHATYRVGDIARELRRQLLPPRQLLEVAGRLEPTGSYIRYLATERFRNTEPTQQGGLARSGRPTRGSSGTSVPSAPSSGQ